MSHNAFASRLVLEPGPSRLLTVYVLTLHGLALGGIALLPVLSPGWRGMLMLILLARLLWAWRQLQQPRWVRIIWGSDNQWRLFGRDGQEVLSVEPPAGHVWRALVLLWLTDVDGNRHGLLLLPDMLAPAQFRRLRVRLGQACRAAAASSPGA